MPQAANAPAWVLPPAQTQSLSERIGALHAQLRRVAPAVDRMACALYDPAEDLLKTFVNSTAQGEALRAYQYRLSDSPSLGLLASERRARVIDHLDRLPASDTAHSHWLRAQGYRSSYTVPIFDGDTFEGFLFFDSLTPAAFTPEVVDRLAVYTQLVALMISHEVIAVQALVGSMRVARDFAHLRDVETGTHLDRMSRYVRLIARSLGGARQLSDEFIEQLFLFAPLHDIGKIGVPDGVLKKPGSLTPAERAVMNEHPRIGAEILGRSRIPLFQLAAEAALTHHERWDGSGYPAGLAGADIPLSGRIVAVVDFFDALTMDRCYRPAFDDSSALQMLAEQRGVAFDPAVVDTFLAHAAEMVAVRDQVNQQGLGVDDLSRPDAIKLPPLSADTPPENPCEAP